MHKCTWPIGPWKGHCISIENILSGLLHSNFGQCVRCKDAKKYLFITILKKEAAKIHPGVYKVTIKRWEGEVGVSHFLDCFLPIACDDSRANRWWLRFMAPSFTSQVARPSLSWGTWLLLHRPSLRRQKSDISYLSTNNQTFEFKRSRGRVENTRNGIFPGTLHWDYICRSIWIWIWIWIWISTAT